MVTRSWKPEMDQSHICGAVALMEEDPALTGDQDGRPRDVLPLNHSAGDSIEVGRRALTKGVGGGDEREGKGYRRSDVHGEFPRWGWSGAESSGRATLSHSRRIGNSPARCIFRDPR